MGPSDIWVRIRKDAQKKQVRKDTVMVSSHEFDDSGEGERHATMMVEQGYILSDDYIVFRFATNNLKFGMRADVNGHTISSRVCDLIPELFPQSFNLQLCGHGHISTDFLGFKLWPAKFKKTQPSVCISWIQVHSFPLLRQQRCAEVSRRQYCAETR